MAVDRRAALKTAVVAAATAGVAGKAVAQGAAAGAPVHPIVLYCDLEVDAAREREMLDHFHKRFKPVGAKHRGFIDLKMLKLRSVIQGDKLPDHVNYRFQLTYENEELRQAWVKSADHAKYWPGIEDCLTDKNFHVSLFDDA
jgi:hypothetical protein